MNHPLIYEIDARCWLRELSARHGPNITLGSAPDDEIKA